MKLYFVFTLFLVLATAMLTSAAEDSCACPRAIYDPVCGVDGKTYANTCLAECEGVAVAYPGECRSKSQTE